MEGKGGERKRKEGREMWEGKKPAKSRRSCFFALNCVERVSVKRGTKLTAYCGRRGKEI